MYEKIHLSFRLHIYLACLAEQMKNNDFMPSLTHKRICFNIMCTTNLLQSGGTTAKEYFKCSGKYMDNALSSKDFRSRTYPFGQRLINKENKVRGLILISIPNEM